MTKILAQHGYGKGQKITDSLETGSLSGAIFSQSAEDIDSITNYVNNTDSLNKNNVYIDPQFYYSTFEPQVSKRLEDNSYFPFNIARRDWRKKNESVIDFIDYHVEQTRKNSNTLITPGFYIEHIDWRFDYSIDIYNYCEQKYDFENYAVSLLIHSSLFSNKMNVQELIEELIDSIDNKDYIYFTICHEKNTDFNYEEIDQNVLANILYAVHILKQSGFKIIAGYTFMNSLLYAMLDCEYVATGWFNTLRKFQSDVFTLEESFGRRKKRYTSIPLLSDIMLEDIAIMLSSGKITGNEILSSTSYDSDVVSGPENVSLVDLEHQYWESLHIGISMFDEASNINERINIMKTKVTRAIKLYDNVIQELRAREENEAAQRIQTSSKHLNTWLNAIDIFAVDASIL